MCADGGANVLHSHLKENCDDAEHIRYGVLRSGVRVPFTHCRRLMPDIIIGDLDSLKPHVRDEFESMVRASVWCILLLLVAQNEPPVSICLPFGVLTWSGRARR